MRPIDIKEIGMAVVSSEGTEINLTQRCGGSGDYVVKGGERGTLTEVQKQDASAGPRGPTFQFSGLGGCTITVFPSFKLKFFLETQFLSLQRTFHCKL